MKFNVLVFIALVLQMLFGCMSKEKLKEKEAEVFKGRLEEYLQKKDSIRVLNDTNRHQRIVDSTLREESNVKIGKKI